MWKDSQLTKGSMPEVGRFIHFGQLVKLQMRTLSPRPTISTLRGSLWS